MGREDGNMANSTIPPASELGDGHQDWPDEPSVVDVSPELARCIQRARARYLRLGESSGSASKLERG